jgi:FdrA protein
MKALRRGLNVMIFSDNVPEQQEIDLKRYATEHGLLVMGPDCGTAIISGAPLAFANVVSRGKIGVVGASGTGTQEVTTIVDRLGEGISHAIGTGGHDLSAGVGGLTMMAGLKMLIEDDETDVIVLVSKPPAKEVAEKVLALAMSTAKPVVVCFLGAPAGSINGPNLTAAATLEAAAQNAVALIRRQAANFISADADSDEVKKIAATLVKNLQPQQRYIRGLYSGGTFCYEALLNLQHRLPELYSNIPTGKVKKLANNYQSQTNTIIDLGDDDFTRGKPHPMIDPSQRNERLIKDAADPETALILFDVVIGYGANADPAAEIAQAIEQAQQGAAKENRNVVFIGFVCGTDKDPQNLAEQCRKLQAVGVHLCHSNAQAIALAGAVMAQCGNNA